MAEVFATPIVEQLLSILRQLVEDRTRLIVGADDDVRNLERKLGAIQCVLEDAESRQATEKTVRYWLEKLNDISYDMDDVLDEWNTAIQKLRIQEVENASKPWRKVCSVVSYYLCCCSRVVFRYEIAHKIKNLNIKLDAIVAEKDEFKFSLNKVTQQLERPMTTSMIDVLEVCGRDYDKNEVVNFLLSESSQESPIHIISIVGMGGIGKTTLARLAFNDDNVKSHFEKKIWVCVSDPFNEIRIAKAILESLKDEKPNLDELETVLRKIRQYVDKKKFLLVFDDVWTENSNDWEQIKNSLKCCSPGSKILVTTRKENVAKVIGSSHMTQIGTLPENDCWSLFTQLAFSGRTAEECKDLKGLGKKIVQRCQGLPLAVKTLGSLLRFKRKLKDWQNVLDNEMWEVKEEKLFPPLLLSFYDLPSILKKCFSYCAIFPKDHVIRKDELIFLWMAQGFIKESPSEDMESIGEKYFEILVVRSFFQDFERDVDGSIISYKMHDIVHDFAQFLTKNESFSLELDNSKKFSLESYEKARHAMIINKKMTQFPTFIYLMKYLRSIVIENDFYYMDNFNLSNIFEQLICLRTLCLREDSIKKFPEGIENLKHLRYLGLFENQNIKELPEALCELYNLQILRVKDCSALQKLPQGMGKLINLRYLILQRTSIRYMPKGFERLIRLIKLDGFAIGDNSCGSKVCKVGCLKNFNHLKSLVIEGLENLVEVDELSRAQLNNKKNLLDLRLNFRGTVREDHEVLLEAVQPPLHLENLGIEEHRGKTIFPSWLMSLSSLKILILSNCTNCEHLPPLGKLPSLESLYILWMSSIRRVGNEILGIESDIATSSSSSASSIISFPKLKSLTFLILDELEDWDYEIPEHVIIMPCIRNLKLYSCPKLKSIPSHLLPMTKSNNFETSFCPLLKEYLDHESQDASTPSPQH